MSDLVMMVTGLVMIVFYVMLFWYLIRTVIIMGRQSALIAILGFFMSPIAQIIFYATSKDKLSIQDRTDFKRYWLSIVLVLVFGIALIFMYSQTMLAI